MQQDFVIPDLPPAPQWSVMMGNLGSALVWVAVLAFVASFGFATFGGRRAHWATPLFWLGSACLAGTFVCLASLFAGQRFEWRYVRDHSDTLTPMAYRIAAVWSGQEGSFLLWGLTSAVFGVLALRVTEHYRRAFTAVYALFLASICGILVYESPFVLSLMHGKAVALPEGMGLAPSLINYWVIIHPPTIFLGFGSLTVPFALAIAAILTGDVDRWIAIVRPWALVALAFVGLGLCMGGFWAYETLGWGGFWMWDPVENTSFVPWCFLAAFVHGILVQIARVKWVWANLLLGALPFLTFVYGTFLTRSGFLGDTSVHSFAEMDRGALWILMAVGGACWLGFFGLWFARGRKLASKRDATVQPVEGFVREDGYRLGNIFLALFGLATAVGMSWPWILSLGGRQPEVIKESIYHQVLPYGFFPIMILMSIVPFIGWRRTDLKEFLNKQYTALMLTIAIMGCVMLVVARTDWAGVIQNKGTIELFFGNAVVPRVPWTIFLTSLCVYVAIANMIRLIDHLRRGPLGVFGFVSHAGVALLLAGLILSRGLEQKAELIVQEGASNGAMGYILTARGHTSEDITDRNNKVRIDVQQGDRVETYLPGMYFMSDRNGDGEADWMVWPYIRRYALHDVYLTLHPMELNASEATPIRPGETKAFDRFSVTYDKMVREGEPGKAGTIFAAKLSILDTETSETFDVSPGLMLAERGLEQVPARIGDFFMTVQDMDAATQTFTLQLHFLKPLYPIELFIKPFTSLVWLGTGIMTLGLLLTAVYRRAGVTPATIAEDPAAEPASEPEPEDHALIPTA